MYLPYLGTARDVFRTIRRIRSRRRPGAPAACPRVRPGQGRRPDDGGRSCRVVPDPELARRTPERSPGEKRQTPTVPRYELNRATTPSSSIMRTHSRPRPAGNATSCAGPNAATTSDPRSWVFFGWGGCAAPTEERWVRPSEPSRARGTTTFRADLGQHGDRPPGRSPAAAWSAAAPAHPHRSVAGSARQLVDELVVLVVHGLRRDSRLDSVLLSHVLTGHRCIFCDRELHRTIYRPRAGVYREWEARPSGAPHCRTDLSLLAGVVLREALHGTPRCSPFTERLEDQHRMWVLRAGGRCGGCGGWSRGCGVRRGGPCSKSWPSCRCR